MINAVMKLTLDFYKRYDIEGLFLNSGVIQSLADLMHPLVEAARRSSLEHAL